MIIPASAVETRQWFVQILRCSVLRSVDLPADPHRAADLQLDQTFSRSWTPHGFLLVIAEGIFTATDPPLRFLRRYIPPLRLGSVALDLSFMVLFFVVLIMVNVVVPLI